MNEEGTKNGEEHCRNRSRKRFRSTSATFFLLLSPSSHQFHYNALNVRSWTHYLNPLMPIYRKGGEEVEQQLAQASCCSNQKQHCSPSPKFSSGPRGLKKVPRWPFCPPFCVFSAFSSKTLKNLTDCAANSVKQLNSARKNPNFSKWSSQDEIRVWQKVNN